VEGLLELEAELRFDGVLAWNLLDYLEAELVAEVFARVDAHCQTGAWLYALATYLHTMPEEPLRFKMVDREHLRHQVPSRRSRPAPRLTARDLARRLPGFRLHTSYLLRNGHQEFLFVRE
jgi:hypothetical protein